MRKLNPTEAKKPAQEPMLSQRKVRFEPRHGQLGFCPTSCWFSRGVPLTGGWVCSFNPVNSAILEASVQSNSVCAVLIVWDSSFQTAAHGNPQGSLQKYRSLDPFSSHSDFASIGCDPGIRTVKAPQKILMHHKLGNHCTRRFSCCSREMRRTTHSWWETAWAIAYTASSSTCYYSASFLSPTCRILRGSVSF